MLANWPDAEDVVMSLLGTMSPPVDATTSTDIDLAEQVPIVRVTRIGGEDDGISDRPLVELAVFHSTYDEARKLAESVRQFVLASPCTKVPTEDIPAGVLIDNASTVTPPARAAYDNPALAMKVLTIRFVWRRPRTSS